MHRLDLELNVHHCRNEQCSEQRAAQNQQRRLGVLGAALLQHRPQRDAVDELHDQHRLAVVLEVLVDADDVGMAELLEHLRLDAEAIEEDGVAGEVGAEVLDRDQSLGVVVAGEPDAAGRAAAELAKLRVSRYLHGHRLTSDVQAGCGCNSMSAGRSCCSSTRRPGSRKGLTSIRTTPRWRGSARLKPISCSTATLTISSCAGSGRFW